MAKCKDCGYELEYCQYGIRVRGDKQFTYVSTGKWLCPECNGIHKPTGSDNTYVHTDKYPN